MCAEWTFATSDLAREYGLTSHAPFEGREFVDWCIGNVGRDDCIGFRPIRLVLDGPVLGHTTGKIILREAYETPSSWRR